MLEKDCTKYKSIEKECDAFVLLYGKDLYNDIVGGVPVGTV